ncbi:hypothetical protein Tco_1205869, partial [Tanacetum coccineum]
MPAFLGVTRGVHLAVAFSGVIPSLAAEENTLIGIEKMREERLYKVAKSCWEDYKELEVELMKLAPFNVRPVLENAEDLRRGKLREVLMDFGYIINMG